MGEEKTNADKAEEEIAEILRKYNCQYDYEIKFPFALGKLPVEVQLALEVVKKARMKVEFIVREEAMVKTQQLP